jgi:hypothetical protein
MHEITSKLTAIFEVFLGEFVAKSWDELTKTIRNGSEVT